MYSGHFTTVRPSVGGGSRRHSSFRGKWVLGRSAPSGSSFTNLLRTRIYKMLRHALLASETEESITSRRSFLMRQFIIIIIMRARAY